MVMRSSSSPTDVESGNYHMAPIPPPPSSLPPPSLQYFHPPSPPTKPWLAWLVPLIFAANIAMFVYSMYVNDCPGNTGDTEQCVFTEYLGRYSFEPLSENPLFGPSIITLQKLGALEKKLLVNNGEKWRLLSCNWLHVGAIHLLANMMSLMFIGIRLEQEFGFFKIGLLYVLSGFGGSLDTLQKLGALEKKLLVNNGEKWRLLSCNWLHVGAIHLLANMMSLMFIGIRLEQEFGFFKIGLLYVLSGFGGSLSSALHLSTSVSVGASGALFGLLGAMLSELITNWTIYVNKCAALSTLVLVISLNLAVGLIPRVDNSAHIGGFISGFLLGFILLIRPQFGYVSRKNLPPGYNMKHMKSRHKCYQYLFCVAALIALIYGYGSGWTNLFEDRILEYY